MEPKFNPNTLYQVLLANREADKDLAIADFLKKYSTWTTMYRSQLSPVRLMSMRKGVEQMPQSVTL